MSADTSSRVRSGGAESISLDDKWTVSRGRVLMSGTQAIGRVLLAQREIDGRRRLKTAGFVSGYRGSPLGAVDSMLWSIAGRLQASDIVFRPGVNEDIAATALRGTQQIDAVPNPAYEGVFAAWYGKGPGVDRCGDAFKHGNYAGAHRNGGVVLFYGDDHSAKSSTVAHHSEQAIAASLIPSLYPADVGELVRYGLLGFALSRFSGSWVGVKCVTEIVEQTASVDIDIDGFSAVTPECIELPIEGVHIRAGSFNPLREEQIVVEHRLPRVHAFVRANEIDRTIFRAAAPRLGLISAGKSYGDVRRALSLLGLDAARAAAIGVSLYKVGCIWPLEPEGLADFAQGHDTLLVIEEKASFIEQQAAAALINSPRRVRLIGKSDETGAPLLSPTQPLQPIGIALAIAARLERLGIADEMVRAARARLVAEGPLVTDAAASLRRSPYFCSGCPHNRSTRVPDGSLSMTGIGCHTMANFAWPAQALLPTQMGGEGGNWIGLAPFTGTKHVFQNMGDGTYFHSGLLAIRAAIAAGVNITYKILYNDAVAMTGGQPVDGPISVAAIAQQVRHEGVERIYILSDDPVRHQGRADLPPRVTVEHRDRLDAVQRALRETRGCSVLIYEQTCAAEKRRRRKRGQHPLPSRRLFIASAVCEGCGDCSEQSTCVSVLPLETELGRKRRIDQSSCNTDLSCLNGFCPSFITLHGAEPRKPQRVPVETALFDDLADTSPAAIIDGSYNLMVAGIGGTGVVTVAAIIAMAAHIDGLAVSIFDMTGLAQKNGAVYSHIRIAHSPQHLHTPQIGRHEADVLLAFDLVAALASESVATLAKGRTRATVNSDVTPTSAFQFDRSATIDSRQLISQLTWHVGSGAVASVDATSIATALMGDSIAVNLFLVGAAAQRGELPVSLGAIERAVQLNGTAVSFNLTAFRLGRLFVARPEDVLSRLRSTGALSEAPLAQTLEDVLARRVEHLSSYQDAAYAARYEALIRRVQAAEQAVAAGSDALALAVARNYAKLLSYKDEYEVARLLTSAALHAELKQNFTDGRLAFNLAPPTLGRHGPGSERPRKREFDAAYMLPLLRLLARLKRLRGTIFDPFGLTGERRMERALIRDYEALVEAVLSELSAANHRAAVDLLGLADQVRGFGPVKQSAVAIYKERLLAARRAFSSAARAAASRTTADA